MEMRRRRRSGQAGVGHGPRDLLGHRVKREVGSPGAHAGGRWHFRRCLQGGLVGHRLGKGACRSQRQRGGDTDRQGACAEKSNHLCFSLSSPLIRCGSASLNTAAGGLFGLLASSVGRSAIGGSALKRIRLLLGEEKSGRERQIFRASIAKPSKSGPAIDCDRAEGHAP